MTPSSRDRAWEQLSERLRELSPDSASRQWIGGTHVRRLADNLVPGMPVGHLHRLRSQLARGAGGELNATASGKRRAHAPYSSAVFALNLFGRWLDHEHQLTVCGLRGFDREVRIEHRLKIAHAGGTANLDVFLERGDLVLGVECKLTETLERHQLVGWKGPYREPAMAGMLSDGWRQVLEASLAGSWQPVHVGVEQLVKHALALSSHHAGHHQHLLYCFWEPVNADDVPEVVAHRAEVAALMRRLSDSPRPRLHVRAYGDILDEWDELPEPCWLRAHVAEIRARYGVAV